LEPGKKGGPYYFSVWSPQNLGPISSQKRGNWGGTYYSPNSLGPKPRMAQDLKPKKKAPF